MNGSLKAVASFNRGNISCTIVEHVEESEEGEVSVTYEAQFSANGTCSLISIYEFELEFMQEVLSKAKDAIEALREGRPVEALSTATL